MKTITKENGIKVGDKVTIKNAADLVEYENRSWFTPELVSKAGQTLTVTRVVSNGQRIMCGKLRVAYAAMADHQPQNKLEELTKGAAVKAVDTVKRNSGFTTAKGRVIYENVRPLVAKVLGTNKWTVKAIEIVSKKYAKYNRVKELVAVLVVSELAAKYGSNLPVIGSVSEATKLPLRAYIVNELSNMVIDKYELNNVLPKVAEAFGINLDDVQETVESATQA